MTDRPSAASNALLLMDLQVGILEGYVPDQAPQLVEAVRRHLDKARAAGDLVVHVGVGFRQGHPEVSARNKIFAPVAASGGMLAGTPATAVPEELQPLDGEVVIVKQRVSAFFGTELDMILRARGVSEISLCGVATSGVVLSTVRAAADLDYSVSVLSDGCADPNPEVQRVLMNDVFPVQAEVR